MRKVWAMGGLALLFFSVWNTGLTAFAESPQKAVYVSNVGSNNTG